MKHRFSKQIGAVVASLCMAFTLAAGPAVAQKGAPKTADQASDPNTAKINGKLLLLQQTMKTDRVPLAEALKVSPNAKLFATSADGNALLVEVICSKLDDGVLKKFAIPGVDVHGYYPEHLRLVLVLTDVSDLKQVAVIPEVTMIEPVYKPRNRFSGNADSRADRALRANGLPVLGITGSGQKVGVLSDSFSWTDSVRDSNTQPAQGLAGNLTGSLPQDSGDLPASVQIVRDDLPGNDEGAAMAELVHDVAPGATIAFHTALGGEAGFAEGINRLRNEAGCSIIVDDVIYFKEPMYQDGLVAQAAAAATKANVPFFSAAGNAANKAFRMNYSDIDRYRSEAVIPPTGKDLHNWGGTGYLPIHLGNGASFIAVLQWNQPFYTLNPIPGKSGSKIDLDMYVTATPDKAGLGTPLVESREGQGTSYLPLGDPFEIVEYSGSNQTVYLAIDHYQGNKTSIPQNSRTKLELRVVFFTTGDVQFQGIPNALSSSGGPTMYGHSLADKVVSVAAVPWWESPNFNPAVGMTTEIDPEMFTARGGTFKIFFNSSGSYMSSPRSVFAPTLAAVDGCNTTFFGRPSADLPSDLIPYDGEPDSYPDFFGTSAAAPNAAAVAALLKSQDTQVTPTELTRRMTTTAIDVKGYRAASGKDDVTGYGLLDCNAALGAGGGGGGNQFVNLAFLKPATWQGGVVINQTLNSPNDAANFSNALPVYVNYNIVNNGNTAAGAFNVQVLVDSVVVQTFPYPALAASAQLQEVNISLGVLSIGQHTIEVKIDPANQVAELLETDNNFSRQINVGGPPSNDNFAAAVDLGTCPGPVTGTTMFASKQGGEPAHGGNLGGASIWYKWTAPPSARPIRVKIDTKGSDFDTLLGVYTGAAVNALTFVAGSDDITPGSVLTSAVEIDAGSNVVYFIAVDGKNGAQGNVALNLSVTPANDNFADRLLLAGASGAVEGINFCATKEAGEPNHAGNAGGKSVWYKWVAPRNGAALFTTEGSNFDTLLAVYVGTGLGTLSPVASNDDVSPGLYSAVVFPISQGVEYQIAVDGWLAAAGNLRLAYSAGASNDFFGAPTILPSICDGAVVSTNVGASTEPNEPSHAGNPGGKSVWFKWTAPTVDTLSSYPVTFDSAGSNFNTLLGVYEGLSIDTVSLKAYNDDANPALSPNTKTSQVSFVAMVGQTYYILVDGLRTGTTVAEGNIVLNWDTGYAPENDYIQQQIYFPGLEIVNGTTLTATIDIPRTNNGASVEPEEPQHAQVPGKRTVWFLFTIEDSPIADVDVRQVEIEIDTNTPQGGCDPDPAGFDTLLAVYTSGPNLGSLQPYAYNDDIVPGFNTDSKVTFIATPGEYYIAVDGKYGTSGNFRFKASNSMAPTGFLPALKKDPSLLKQYYPDMLVAPK
jgi:hypothetical protein